MNYYLDIETTLDHKTIRLIGIYNPSHPSKTMSYFTKKDGHICAFMSRLEEGDTVYTFNGVAFDFRIIKELWELDCLAIFREKKIKHIDLYLLSKMKYPDRKEGHSLDSWGPELQASYKSHKPEDPSWYDDASIADIWDYCKKDLEVTKTIASYIHTPIPLTTLAKGNWGHPLRVESEVRDIINAQAKRGVHFDKPAAILLRNHIGNRMLEIEKEMESHLPVMPLSPSRLHYPPKKQFRKDGTPSKHLETYCNKYDFCLKYTISTGEWEAISGTDKRNLPLTEPLVTTEKITLASQENLKTWLMACGWKPTQWNYKESKGPGFKTKTKTSPRLADKVTKEPCPGLSIIGYGWGALITEWLMLRSRANVLHSLANDTGWIPSVRDDGTLVSDADTVGTPTARFRHKGIANVPRVTRPYGKEMRSLFIPREGLTQVGWDASSLEACMEAHYVYPYDKDYANELVSGDVHERNRVALGLSSRDRAKTFKYAITYGATPNRLASSLSISKSRASKLYEEFWDKNLGLRLFKEDLEREWKSLYCKYLVGLDGRLISTRSKHSLLNTKLQSAGAIVMKHAMLIAEKSINDYVAIYNSAAPRPPGKDNIVAEGLIRYHDEEQWQCTESIADDVGALGVNSIRLAGEFLDLNVPLSAEYKIGSNWAECH
jgi:hypothetical protein